MKRGERISPLAVAIVYERDEGCCIHCKKKIQYGRFSIHHKKYRSRGGSNDPINLCLLCLECHTATHDGKKSHAKYRTASYQKEGQSEDELK